MIIANNILSFSLFFIIKRKRIETMIVVLKRSSWISRQTIARQYSSPVFLSCRIVNLPTQRRSRQTKKMSSIVYRVRDPLTKLERNIESLGFIKNFLCVREKKIRNNYKHNILIFVLKSRNCKKFYLPLEILAKQNIIVDVSESGSFLAQFISLQITFLSF